MWWPATLVALASLSAAEGAARSLPWPSATRADATVRPANVDVVRELWQTSQIAEPLSLRISRSSIRVGEQIEIVIDVPVTGYLNVVGLDAEGAPTVLFPNALHPDNRVRPGRFSVPGPAMQFRLQAEPPYGLAIVAAFHSRSALNLATLIGDKRQGDAVKRGLPFADLSLDARDELARLTTQSLLAADRGFRAGLASVRICPASGPCEPLPGKLSTLPSPAGAAGVLVERGQESAAESADRVEKLRPIYPPGVKLTKVSEGFVATPYNDVAGYCTIGYGHLIFRATCDDRVPSRFRGGITEPTGEHLLQQDLATAQRAVMQLVKIGLTDGQFAALSDFTFNVGVGAFRRSTLLRRVNDRAHHDVPDEMRRWRYAGGKELRALKIRRERALALYFDGQPIPRPRTSRVSSDSPIDIWIGELREDD